MGLKTASVWSRLRTLLAYHAKLVQENKDKKKMDRVGTKIRHFTYLLEKQNKALIDSHSEAGIRE